MPRDINRFKKELIDYINNFIVGREDTCIIKALDDDIIMNRGHAIPLRVKLPEDVDAGEIGYSPTFYMEELLEEFPMHTPAAIAEIVGVRMNQRYPDVLKMLKEQAKSVSKTLSDYRTDELIITAQPTDSCRILLGSDNPFIVKELPELGLIISLKGIMCENPSNENQVYVTPIKEDKDQEMTEEMWDTAKYNSLTQAQMHCMLTAPSGCEEFKTPMCGEVMDVKSFYDYL